VKMSAGDGAGPPMGHLGLYFSEFRILLLMAAFGTRFVRSSGFEDEEARLMVRLKTVVATGALAVASLLTAVPAHAQSTYVGKVTANGGLTVRHLPTTASATEGRLNNGQQIEIICKVRGSSVNGNDSWYSLPPTLNEWVSARYVQNIGSAPRWCGSTERFVGRTTRGRCEHHLQARRAARERQRPLVLLDRPSLGRSALCQECWPQPGLVQLTVRPPSSHPRTRASNTSTRRHPRNPSLEQIARTCPL